MATFAKQTTATRELRGGAPPARWVGRAASALFVLFMIFDTILHLARPAPVAASFTQLGYPLSLAVALGVLELLCIALYVIPRTAVVGAVLVTGYLGGAVASQLRVGHSAFETVFPVIIGLLAWAGLVLRDGRVRDVLLGLEGARR